jgi:hypothetical protein
MAASAVARALSVVFRPSVILTILECARAEERQMGDKSPKSAAKVNKQKASQKASKQAAGAKPATTGPAKAPGRR